MLDINQIDITNIVENWLANFNETLEKAKNAKEKNFKIDLSYLFHKESHWRDLISFTCEIITFSEI